MTAPGTLLVQPRLPISNKKNSLPQQKLLPYHHRHQSHLFKAIQAHKQHSKKTMSKALARELDLKMQQVREYALIAHGYHNENFQYPVHVRRSHDGEKVSTGSHRKKTRPLNSTVLTPSSHENRTKTKQKDLPTRQTVLTIPPNKTISDINPSLNSERFSPQRKSSLSSTNSSPILCSSRPHSIAGLSSPAHVERPINSLSNSAQSLLNQSSPPTKTLTQRFFSRFFHHSSKS